MSTPLAGPELATMDAYRSAAEGLVAPAGEPSLVTALAIMRRPQGGQVMQRIYTSRAAEYPVGGAKLVERDLDPRWSSVCLSRHEPYVGADAESLTVFVEHELLASMGLASVVCLPAVTWLPGGERRTVGILSILGGRGIAPRQLEALTAASAPALAVVTDAAHRLEETV